MYTTVYIVLCLQFLRFLFWAKQVIRPGWQIWPSILQATSCPGGYFNRCCLRISYAKEEYETVFRLCYRWIYPGAESFPAAGRRLQRPGFSEAAGWCGLHLEYADSLQYAYQQAGRKGGCGGGSGRRQGDYFRDDHCCRRHCHGN